MNFRLLYYTNFRKQLFIMPNTTNTLLHIINKNTNQHNNI